METDLPEISLGISQAIVDTIDGEIPGGKAINHGNECLKSSKHSYAQLFNNEPLKIPRM